MTIGKMESTTNGTIRYEDYHECLWAMCMLYEMDGMVFCSGEIEAKADVIRLCAQVPLVDGVEALVHAYLLSDDRMDGAVSCGGMEIGRATYSITAGMFAQASKFTVDKLKLDKHVSYVCVRGDAMRAMARQAYEEYVVCGGMDPSAFSRMMSVFTRPDRCILDYTSKSTLQGNFPLSMSWQIP